MENFKRCETCKWSYLSDIDDSIVCVNADSPYCSEWIAPYRTCAFYENEFINLKKELNTMAETCITCLWYNDEDKICTNDEVSAHKDYVGTYELCTGYELKKK